MLIEDLKTPVLMFALDVLETSSVETYGALSVENSEVLQAEIEKKREYKKKALATDISDHLSRIVIPINDRLLPIHYVGGYSSQSNAVNYLDENAVLTKSGNQVSLTFELKSSLTTLSIIADLILGIANKEFFSSNQPRVSFFSTNLAVYNAYLRGINRTTASNTDKEVLTLSLEVAPNRVEIPVKEDRGVENNSFDNVLDGALSSKSAENFLQIGLDEIDYSYNWYELFTVDEINKIEVPDYLTEFTVERETVRFMRVNSTDFSENPRNMITIEFKNTFITLLSESGQVLEESLGVMMFNNSMYLGVKIEN